MVPRDADASTQCLHRLQVTTRSVLGALAWESGGLLVDHGWLRLLGGGPDLPDLATASGLGEPTDSSEPPPFLTVGYDVLGGRFAVNGGGLPGEPGEVCFYAPDDLDWEPLDMGHGSFIEWALTGDVAGFYADLRWPGGEQEASGGGLDQGLSVYPPLFTREAKADLAGASRRPVPLEEVLEVQEHMAEQLRGLSDGATFRIDPGS